MEEELAALGLSAEASAGIVAATGISSLGDLEALLGSGDPAVAELAQLFALAAGYGFADWLQLDTSCVRGLAYYTGARARVLLARTLPAACLHRGLRSALGMVDTSKRRAAETSEMACLF